MLILVTRQLQLKSKLFSVPCLIKKTGMASKLASSYRLAGYFLSLEVHASIQTAIHCMLLANTALCVVRLLTA